MHTAANTAHNFDTYSMRTLVTFMSRRHMPKDAIDTGYFTEAEREEFDRLCAETDVISVSIWKMRMDQSQDDEDEEDVVPSPIAAE